MEKTQRRSKMYDLIRNVEFLHDISITHPFFQSLWSDNHQLNPANQQQTIKKRIYHNDRAYILKIQN